MHYVCIALISTQQKFYPLFTLGDKLNRDFTTVLSSETEHNTKSYFAMLEVNGDNALKNLTL
jgi:thiosulfate reductase cytochrome b subunit